VASFAWVVVWTLYFRDNPRDHPGITQNELDRLPAHVDGRRAAEIPWGALVRRMWPVTLVYFCYGWTLWLFLSWIPSYFLHNHHLDLKHSALFASGVFFAGVVGDTAGGVISDWLAQRTSDLKRARRNLVMVGLIGAALSLVPLLLPATSPWRDLLEPGVLLRQADHRPDVGDLGMAALLGPRPV
jgi:MFS family permease